MFQTFTITLEKQFPSPKNWRANNVSIDWQGRFALAGENLWDLKERKLVPGLWKAIHPQRAIGLKLSNAGNDSFLELRSLPDDKNITRFEEKGFLEMSPYDHFATYALFQDAGKDRENMPLRSKCPIYNTESGNCMYMFEEPFILGTFLADQQLALINNVGKTSIFNLQTGNFSARLKGLGRKPSFIRTDRHGKKLFIYGMNWKKKEGMYKLWDAQKKVLLTEQSGDWIRFGQHVTFHDGIRVVGDTAILDTRANELHELWLGIYYNAPHVPSLVALPEQPYFAAIVCRDRFGIKNQLEIWNVESRKLVGSIDLGKRPHAVIPAGENRVAVFHSLGGKPIYDDTHDPALSIYSLERKEATEYPVQPEPGSYFFELIKS